MNIKLANRWDSRERERESYSLEESVSKASVVCIENKYVKLKSYI